MVLATTMLVVMIVIKKWNQSNNYGTTTNNEKSTSSSSHYVESYNQHVENQELEHEHQLKPTLSDTKQLLIVGILPLVLVSME